MKKFLTLAAAAVLAVSASAQTVQESKTFDNIYVGVNGGLATKLTGHSWMSGLDPNFGIRVGRYITPVLGYAVQSNAYFSNKPWASDGTAVRALNTSFLGTINLSNWFGGYKGQPRPFEVSALYGLGWGHSFGTKSNDIDYHKSIGKANSLTSTVAFDFAWNFGSDKEWQAYVEPSVIWGLNGFGYRRTQYNINRGFAQINVGVNYKFKTSNGTHNFKIAELKDQSEIDALNSKINDLQEELAKKPKEVIKEVPAAAETKEIKVSDLMFVTFAQGKSELTRDAKKALDGVKSGSHVEIVGTASPEGNADLNQKLSEARANAVADYLKSKGVNVDEANGKGVQGTTSGRLAIVRVK